MTVREYYFVRPDGTKQDLPAYDDEASADDVRKTYAAVYPELNNAVPVYHDAGEGVSSSVEFQAKAGAARAVVKAGPSVEFKASVGKKG